MDSYKDDKTSMTKEQPYNVAEDSILGKATPVAPLSKSWVKEALLTVETRGIQRVTEEERQQNTSKVWNACTFWYGNPSTMTPQKNSN